MSVRKRGDGPKVANGTANGYANGSIHKDEKAADVRTDLTRWRLKNDRGRQTWHYLETEEELKAWPLSTADKYFLGLDTVRINPQSSQRIQC